MIPARYKTDNSSATVQPTQLGSIYDTAEFDTWDNAGESIELFCQDTGTKYTSHSMAQVEQVDLFWTAELEPSVYSKGKLKERMIRDMDDNAIVHDSLQDLSLRLE